MDAIDRAAIRSPEGVVYSIPRPGRHHNVIRVMSEAGDPFVNCDCEQGFLTTAGCFVDRIEAARIALAAGQILSLHAPPNLYSEDLW